jgi:methylase of polypeptide subunit release factors
MNYEIVTWKGRCGPFELKVAPDTFRPTTVSRLVAESMEVTPGSTVIDVGCGSGVLAIIAAKLGAGEVHGVDAAESTVDVGMVNALGQGVADLTHFYRGSVFEPLPEGLEADLIIGDISGIPDEIAKVSGWFPVGLAGGPTGAELPIRMLDEVKKFLRKGGRFLIPTGSLQDESSILEKARSVFSSLRELTEKPIPLPSALAEHPAVIDMVRQKVIDITQRGSRFLWTARIWEGTA